LTPPDAVSMLIMMVPLLLLYEVSIVCAWIVTKRRARREQAASAAGLVLLLLVAATGRVEAQGVRPPRDTTRVQADSGVQGRALDSATARRLGLPTGPTRSFPASDAVIDSLLKLKNHRVTRYVADTVLVEGDSAISLWGEAFVDRDGTKLDSGSTRLYGARSEITSDDNPVPDYHFGTHQVKWLSKNVMVGRPAVLYIRDVPIMWLPFIFNDIRPGRRSGILVPRFGLNDLVR